VKIQAVWHGKKARQLFKLYLQKRGHVWLFFYELHQHIQHDRIIKLEIQNKKIEQLEK
jgi:hypothetical protein